MSWATKPRTISGNQIINSTVTFENLGCVKDEDDMGSNSNVHLPTQQSVKAYVDGLVNRSLDQHAIITAVESRSVTFNLTTSTTIIWTEFDTAAYSEKRMHTARFELDLVSGSSTYRNEGQFYIYITVPSGETAYSLGTATYESAPASFDRIISFSGNITDLLSAGGSIGLNLDSSAYFADRSVMNYYYSNSDNKTYVRYNSYPSELISSGNSATIYFDPFHFATTGANLIVEGYTVELPYTVQDSVVTLKAKLGCVEQQFNYSLRAKETNTGDTLTIHKVRHELITQKVSELLFPVNISDTTTATDAGILTNQNYCGGNYFADNYVGDKREL